MTGVPATPRGSVGRRGARSPNLSRPVSAGTFLIALLVFGLLLRLFIAGPYLPFSGFRTDMVAFTGWAMRLADTGPAGFYAIGYFSDYPPGYMYVLWGLGSIGQALEPLVGVDITRGLVKLPGIFADLGVAALLYALCKRFAGQLLPAAGAAVGARLGLAAATVYLLNPGVIFNSAVWGQIDSVGSLLLLGTIYLLARGWTEAASVTAVLALLVKFQLAFLIPVVAVVGLRRHLFGRSTDPAHDGRREPLRVLTSIGAGVLTLVLLILPFGMTIWAEGEPGRSLIGKFIEAANTYTGLTVNALNPWRLPFTGPTGPLPGYGDTLHGGTDTIVLFGLGSLDVTAQIIGAALFTAVALLALWQVARRDDLFGVLLAALLLAVAFFVLPTRVHERYLFPALVFAAPLVLRSPRWAGLYAALSFFFLANIYWVYTADWSFVEDAVINPGAFGAPMPRDPLMAATLFSDAGVYLLSAAVALPLAWIAWRAMAVARSPHTDADAAPLALAEPPPETVEVAPAPVRAAPASVSDIGPDEPPSPAWWKRFAWMRTDPADPLLREPGRRLDRLDAALVLGLVLLALAFRLWHLDVPRGMHFDEVYHARSATEWLADWQHGWRRDVYEWTHPMLAKYLIAGGILVADPNKVTDDDTLEAPAPALAVAPRRSSMGFDRSIAFTAGSGDEVVARDLESDTVVARWSADGPVTSLAYDDESVRLLVGLATSGTVAVYDLNAFLAATGERAPPPPATPIESGLDAVSEIVLPHHGDMVLLRGEDGIAAVERVTGAVLAAADLQAGGIGYITSVTEGGVVTIPALVAVTDSDRNAIVLLDAGTLTERSVLEVEPQLIGPLIARGSGADQQVFALTGALPANDEHGAVAGGLAVVDADREELVDVAPLPGAARAIGWQPVANVVYAAGTDADGEPTLWTVQPQGEARRESSAGFAPFDATSLPGQPLALAFDVSRHAQSDDAGDLLISTAADDGARLVGVDAGSNAFAWRLAPVAFGSLLVGLVYLLGATMFSRRRIAVLAAAFIAFDGMSYVMSRIAMNDIFVAVFIVAAYLLFWQVWSGRWSRSAWWALPAVGVLIGLAAASKWVGFYALAGLWVLVLARSELGRLVLVAAIAFLAVVAGLGAPWPFTVVVVAALALALLLVYRRPIRLDLADLTGLAGSVAVLAGLGAAFGLAYDAVPGREPRNAVETLFAVLARGAEAGWPVLLMLAIGAALLAARGVRSLLDPASDRRWFQPGELGGFGWAWVGASLLIVPLTVYGLTYLPYLQLGHAFAIPDTGPGYHWSLDELHSQMFGYHYGLTASHAAAAPWWSWPLDLKTTWFFSGDYDGDRTAVIYNGGNPLLFWAGVPAIVACGILAWRRRSLALVLLVVAYAFQFLPWTRIERATFIYHYLTAVLFAMVAVAYLVDELLRRPQLRELGVAYLAAATVAGILIFPLGWALPMPDWYINAARSLPPWNYYFIFPDPPQGERAELVAADTARLVLGLVLSAAAVVFALVGRDWLERRRRPAGDEEVGAPATEAG